MSRRKFRIGWRDLETRQTLLLGCWVPPSGWAKANAPYVAMTEDGPFEVTPSFVSGPFVIYPYGDDVARQEGLFLRLGHRRVGALIVAGCDPTALAAFADKHRQMVPWDSFEALDDVLRLTPDASRTAFKAARESFKAQQIALLDTMGTA